VDNVAIGIRSNPLVRLNLRQTRPPLNGFASMITLDAKVSVGDEMNANLVSILMQPSDYEGKAANGGECARTGLRVVRLLRASAVWPSFKRTFA
jgi:hypothetical protein